ncbi:MAG: hypothetical protein ABFE08_08630 [Armatimonadia bacterium]
MFWPRLVLSLLGLFGWAMGAVQAQQPPLQLQFVRCANTFYRDERVRIGVVSSGTRQTVTYQVTDFWRRTVRRGSFPVGAEQPVTLDLAEPGTGWYRLVLQHPEGVLEDTFCVLPRPYEDPGNYNLFGLCPDGGCTEDNMEPAAQMGVRVARQTVPWPQVQLKRDEWRVSFLDESYRASSKYGIQLMLILGYTPAWVAEKPINYLDSWVEAAPFTWHPKESNEFGRYLDAVTAYAAERSVTWPSAAVLPEAGAGTLRQQLPWAHSWEMWNEADIMFYVGDWNRYLDLLHMAWAAGRRDLPDVPMIYGGSTGNWHAMGVTASGSGRYCFDYGSLHTGGDLEDCLRVWYGGAQQIPWVVGTPRETMHTECYAQGRRGTVNYPDYNETPGELLRTYLVLKAWREAGFFRSGILGGFIWQPGGMCPGTTLLHRQPDGSLSPSPLYPAFACARKLLSDATEVGPVSLGSRVTAHVFLKHGKVMLAAWSDDGALSRVYLEPGAVRVDAMGQEHSLNDLSYTTRALTAEPTVLIGVKAKYLDEAMRRRFGLLADTAYGTPQTNPACTVWYARPLYVDLGDLVGPSGGKEFRQRVEAAARRLGLDGAGSVEGVLRAQLDCYKLMGEIVERCPVGKEVPPAAADALWRLARIGEWLGEIADDRSALWGNSRTSELERSQLARRLNQARARIGVLYKASDLPVADQLLRRAQRQLWQVQQYRRRGTYQAVLHKIYIAERLMRVEMPVVLRVVPMVDFTTGRCLRKARLLEPGPQVLNAWVYNYLEEPVSGTLRLKLPTGWVPEDPEVRFTAQPGQPSAMVPVRVTVSEDPKPWAELWSFTMDGFIKLGLPATLNDRPLIEVEGSLDNGERFSPMGYYVNTGRWLDDPTLQTASRRKTMDSAQAKLALPEAVRRVQAEVARRVVGR